MEHLHPFAAYGLGPHVRLETFIKSQLFGRWLWLSAAGKCWPQQTEVGHRWLWPAAAGQGGPEQAQVGQRWRWQAAAGKGWPEQAQV